MLDLSILLPTIMLSSILLSTCGASSRLSRMPSLLNHQKLIMLDRNTHIPPLSHLELRNPIKHIAPSILNTVSWVYHYKINTLPQSTALNYSLIGQQPPTRQTICVGLCIYIGVLEFINRLLCDSITKIFGGLITILFRHIPKSSRSFHHTAGICLVQAS
jgi:hypothetical protein